MGLFIKLGNSSNHIATSHTSSSNYNHTVSYHNTTADYTSRNFVGIVTGRNNFTANTVKVALLVFHLLHCLQTP
jgi:hypothetical protein